MIHSLPVELEAKVLSYLDDWELMEYCIACRPVLKGTPLGKRVSYIGDYCIKIQHKDWTESWILYDDLTKEYHVYQCDRLVLSGLWRNHMRPQKKLRFK